MAKKSFGLVMLVAVLAFGMALTGCDNNGGTSVSPIDGRWDHAVYSDVLVIGNGTMRWYYGDAVVDTVTFTISGNNITMRWPGGETDTATFALSNNGNTLTFTWTDDGESWTSVYNRRS